MDLLLTILKFGGIIVSGALGILGTITETHREVDVSGARPGDSPRTIKSLTLWGKWALALTISGFVVALGAQIAEQVKSHSEKQSSQEQSRTILMRLEEQSLRAGDILSNVRHQNEVAADSLNSIERLMTQLETVSARAYFTVSPTNPFLAALNRHFEGLTNIFIPVENGNEFHLTPAGFSVTHFGGGLTEAMRRSLEKTVEGYTNLGRLIPASFGKLVSIDLDRIHDADVTRFLPPLAEFEPFLQSLRNASLNLTIWRKTNMATVARIASMVQHPDFEISKHDEAVRVVLHWYGGVALIAEYDSFHYPKREWISNGRISSLQDLPGSILDFYLYTSARASPLASSNPSEVRGAQMRLRRLEVKLNAYAVTFTEEERQFPSVEEIMRSPRPLLPLVY